MEIAIFISISGMVISLLSLIINTFRGSKKDTKEDTSAIVGLQADMKHNLEKLDDINKKLDRIERSNEQNNIAIIRIETDIKAMWKQIDLLRDRILRIENHFGFKDEVALHE